VAVAVAAADLDAAARQLMAMVEVDLTPSLELLDSVQAASRAGCATISRGHFRSLWGCSI
jgi:hypothetical protein